LEKEYGNFQDALDIIYAMTDNSWILDDDSGRSIMRLLQLVDIESTKRIIIVGETPQTFTKKLSRLRSAGVLDDENSSVIVDGLVNLMETNKEIGVDVDVFFNALFLIADSGIIDDNNLTQIGNRLIDSIHKSQDVSIYIILSDVIIETLEEFIPEHILREIRSEVARRGEEDEKAMLNWLKSITKFNYHPNGIEIAFKVVEAGYWPLEELINPILEENEPLLIVDERIAKYQRLKQELHFRLPNLNNEIEVILYYAALIDKADCFVNIGYKRYEEMIANIAEFLDEHTEFDNPFDLRGYRKFNIVGEIVTYLQEILDIVNNQIEVLRGNYEYLINLDFENLIVNEFGEFNDSLDFHKRILAYLVYKTSDNPPQRILNRMLTNFIRIGYKWSWVSSDVTELFENSTNVNDYKNAILSMVGDEITNLDLIDAVFAVSFLGYQPADRPERQRLKYLMIETIVATSMEEEAVISILAGDDYDLKLQALDQVYHEDRIGIIRERTSVSEHVVGIVKGKLHVRQEAVQIITEEGVEVDENVDTFILTPVKFDAIFRGYTFLDCSRQDTYGHPYVWTVHPDNMYYLVKKNGRVFGYIGLSETYIEGTRQKVLAVDTLQFHGREEMVKSTLSALKEQAVNLGFSGIALPKSLSKSFNSEVIKDIVKSLEEYREGREVKLEYIHGGYTKILIETYGEDQYHSLFASDLFILFETESTVEVDTESGQVVIEMVYPGDWGSIKDEIIVIEEEIFSGKLQQDEGDLGNTFKDPVSICLVARGGDRVIGYVMGGPLKDYDYLPGVEEDENYVDENTIYLESRAVLNDYQGKGIVGANLKEEFIRRARQRGYEYVTGHIREDYVPEGAEIVSIHENYQGTGLTFVYYSITL